MQEYFFDKSTKSQARNYKEIPMFKIPNGIVSVIRTLKFEIYLELGISNLEFELIKLAISGVRTQRTAQPLSSF